MNTEGHSGTRSLLIVLAAVVIVVGIIAGTAYFGKKPPVITGEIIKLDAVPTHAEIRTTTAGTQGVGGGTENYDEVLVLAQVRLHNQSRMPFFLHDMSSNLTDSDGSQQNSLGVNRSDFQTVFAAYPKLTPLRQPQLQRDITIGPGESTEGMVIFHYPITKDQWDARRHFKVVFSFTNEKDLVVPWK